MNHQATKRDVSFDRPPVRLSAAPATMARMWSRTKSVQEIARVVQAVEEWPGVVVVPDQSGLCLALRGVTLGHVRWSGRIDLPFGPEVRERLLAEEMACRDPDDPEKESLIFQVRTAADVDRAVWLLRLAYLSADPKVNICLESAAAPPPGARGEQTH